MIIKAFVEGFTFGVKVIGVLTSIVTVSALILAVEYVISKIRGSDE